MKYYLTWFRLLNKRLYKKPTFVVLMLLIPLLTLCLGILSKQESGFVHVALAAEVSDGAGNGIADEIIDDLPKSSEFIRFTKCETTAEAAAMVRRGDADAAWIFPADFEQRLADFSRTDSRRLPALTVVEREETIPLRISHEKLCSALYKYCSRALYIDFIRGDLPELDHLPDDALFRYYEEFDADGEMFAFESANSAGETVESSSYLLAPVRGLLSVVVTLSGIAAALFAMQDERKGSFSFLPYSKKPAVDFACGMIAVGNVAAVMLLSLYAAGLGGGILREIPALLLLAVSSTLFGMLLRQITGSLGALCALLPLLTVLLIAICPIFFSFRALTPVQLLFPPTYYARAIYQNAYFGYMAVYCAILAGAYAILRRLRPQAG